VRTKRRVKTLSETAVQEHAVKLLEAYGRLDIEWHHVPNGEKRGWKTGIRLKAMGVKPGVADLMFLIDATAIAVEIKTEIGTQSDEQEAFQERFERAGGTYYIARGLDQTVDILKHIGAFRGGINFTVTKRGERASA
jgi:hypothetical protein